MTINERLQYISQISLKFDYDNYLKSEGKSLIIFEIDTINSRYKLFYGKDKDELVNQANEKYFDAKAGYLFDLKTQFKTGVEADLLLLADVVLNSNPIDLDTMIVHELTHFMIESGRTDLINLSENAKILGDDLYKLTDRCNEDRTRHTEIFCKVLSQLCINYNQATHNFISNFDVMKSAMRFDIFED